MAEGAAIRTANQIEQVRAWFVRHELDQLAALTAEAVIAARTADREAARIEQRARQIAAEQGEAHVFGDPELGPTARGLLRRAERELRAEAAELVDARALPLVNRIDEPSGASVIGSAGSSFPIGWPTLLGLDPERIARDVADKVAAERARETESPLDVMRRIGRETGQPVTRVEPAAGDAPRRTRRRNRLVINGEQIA
jgi:hypothetical protein